MCQHVDLFRLMMKNFTYYYYTYYFILRNFAYNNHGAIGAGNKELETEGK